jgi:TIR domain
MKVFLSYARADGIKIADELESKLLRRKHEVFRDVTGIAGGAEWEKELIQRIQWCDSLVMIVTKVAGESKYVYQEFREAEKKQKLIIPVQINQTPLPVYLQQLHALPLQFISENDNNLDKIILQLEDAWRNLPEPSPWSRLKPWLYKLAPLFIIFITLVGAILVEKLTDDNKIRSQPEAATDYSHDIMPIAFTSGSEYFEYIGESGSMTTQLTQDCAHSNKLGLKVDADFLNGGFGGWGFHWNNALEGHFDASGFSKVVFWVKGMISGENFDVGLKDIKGQEIKLAFANLTSENLDDAKWIKVSVDLDKFTGLDIASIENFNLGFNPRSGQGSLCVDDIGFE